MFKNLKFTKKNIAIIAGVAAAVIVIIALIAGGGNKTEKAVKEQLAKESCSVSGLKEEEVIEYDCLTYNPVKEKEEIIKAKISIYSGETDDAQKVVCVANETKDGINVTVRKVAAEYFEEVLNEETEKAEYAKETCEQIIESAK